MSKIGFQPVSEGMVFGGIDGTSRQVLRVFGRGANRKVRYRNLMSGTERCEKIGYFRSLITFQKVPEVTS